MKSGLSICKLLSGVCSGTSGGAWSASLRMSEEKYVSEEDGEHKFANGGHIAIIFPITFFVKAISQCVLQAHDATENRASSHERRRKRIARFE